MFDFGQAITELKAGNKVARSGWNGKGMHLEIADVSDVYHDNGLKLDAFIYMKTSGNTMVPWLASQTVVLAEDWQIVD